MGCRMSLKMHMLRCRLGILSENMGDVSDEHGGRLHQDLAQMEKRYQGRIELNMIGDNKWNLLRHVDSSTFRKPVEGLTIFDSKYLN